MMSRRGVTLLEMLIGLVMASILGASLLTLGHEQAKFGERVERGQRARAVSRTAINYLGSELRMTDAHGGVALAEPRRLRVRTAFAVGLVCSATGTQVTAAFMPVDSTLLTMGYSGFGLRNPLSGLYEYHLSDQLPTAGSTSTCTTVPASITPIAGGLVRTLTGTIPFIPAPSTPVVLLRTVEYEFAPSTILPGRQALWRRTLNSANAVLSEEELAAPFDAQSRFRFFILNQRVPSDTVPTALEDLRGVEFVLSGESEGTARGRAAPEQANLSTSIFFLNRMD